MKRSLLNPLYCAAGADAPVAQELEVQLASIQQQIHLLLEITTAQAQLAVMQRCQPLQASQSRAGAALVHAEDTSDEDDLPHQQGGQQVQELVKRIESLVRQARR